MWEKTNQIASVHRSRRRGEEFLHFSWIPRVLVCGFSVYVAHLLFFRLDLTLPQRPNIPPSLQQATTSSQLDISTWGIPTASYPNSTCTMETFFPPQQLVLLTTLCGVWYVQTEILILSFNLYVWYKGWNTIGLRGDLSNAYWLLCTSCPLRSKVHY